MYFSFLVNIIGGHICYIITLTFEKHKIMTAIVFSIIKILIMLVILGAMILILLGIGQLLHHDEEYEETDFSSFKKEVEEKEKVIGKNSVFNNFLVRNSERSKKG